VCIYAKDPMTLSPQTEELMDALAELSEGLTWDEYAAPVTEDMLLERKRERNARGGSECDT